MIVSWAIENNLVYLRSILVYDCDYDKLLVVSTGWFMIMISSWAIGNNLVYFWGIMAGSMIVIVSWAIEK